ncbi:hypothetical protein SAMN04488109_5497 [Chryseolinea serpens]|uniref:Phospholipase_D-nuclease N-terminal n=1 Tax=Chryseolinea serpens TaxID=947013 RepID=A0A1M5VXE5_9BACT|nr:hypothetical protein [Chryseolinea serpens]SHH79906.1 hypothetical protein SAMN04488109_5497 [Chryseolinea serpens]
MIYLKINIMTLISFAGWASLILSIIALVLIYRAKEMSYVDTVLWTLDVLIVPAGPVFFFIYLLMEKNKKKK